jgi:molybdopterin-guanine dinucleotide biosynthesis protein A
MQVPDKTTLAVGGISLLDRVLAATDHAHSIVVAGPERPVARPVTWVHDEPADGGPAAAVAAALDAITADIVVLLAADLPLVTSGHLDRLVAEVADDGAVFVDAAGAEQWLCSAWRARALREASLEIGGSLHRALSSLTFARLSDQAAAFDCDTPDDLRRAEELLT